MPITPAHRVVAQPRSWLWQDRIREDNDTFLIEISYEMAAAQALPTLVLEAGEKFPTALSGKRSDGCTLAEVVYDAERRYE